MILLSEVLPIKSILTRTLGLVVTNSRSTALFHNEKTGSGALPVLISMNSKRARRERANSQAASFVASARTRVEPFRVALTTFISCQS